MASHIDWGKLLLFGGGGLIVLTSSAVRDAIGSGFQAIGKDLGISSVSASKTDTSGQTATASAGSGPTATVSGQPVSATPPNPAPTPAPGSINPTSGPTTNGGYVVNGQYLTNPTQLYAAAKAAGLSVNGPANKNATSTAANVYGRALWAFDHNDGGAGYDVLDRADQVTWNSVALDGH